MSRAPALTVQVGPTVVTRIFPVRRGREVPTWPADTWFTVQAVAGWLGIRHNTVQVYLYRHPERFDPPRYYQLRKQRHRLLSPAEAERLRQVYPVTPLRRV